MNRCLIFSFFLAVTLVRAESPRTMRATDALHQNLLLQHPPPDYPYELRRRRVVGTGLFLLRFDYESGHLRQVHIAKSTGSKELDAAAVAALKHWQAKPRSVYVLEMPISFVVGGAR